jgi:hypothetical protein
VQTAPFGRGSVEITGATEPRPKEAVLQHNGVMADEIPWTSPNVSAALKSLKKSSASATNLAA